MTSPISVLLIIGSAVVGPIEANIVKHSEVTMPLASTECVWRSPFCTSLRRWLPSGSITDQCIRDQRALADKPDCNVTSTQYESLPELCERAMREVGAEPVRHMTLPAGSKQYEVERTQWVINERGSRFNDQKWTEVRCLPTPQGYRK